MLPDSIFCFTVNCGEAGKTVQFGNLTIRTGEKTPTAQAVLGERELLIFGCATDVTTGQYHDLPQNMLESTQTLTQLIAYEARLGGKYLLFYKDETGSYVIPDASGSIPFCYSTREKAYASNPEDIAKALGLTPDADLLKIRKSGDISQAMPYDVTVYESVMQLLPNHYFCVETGTVCRFVNAPESLGALTPEAVAEQITPYMKNLLQYYKIQFPVYCPITSGRDSRVVLAHLLAQKTEDYEQVVCYTIKHDRFRENEQDLVIPKKLAEAFGLSYRQIPDEIPSEELKASFDTEFGKTGYCPNTLKIAHTIHTYYDGGAVLNGDIVGQVGKCSLHRDIPQSLATAGYFRCKLHNYSREAKELLHIWLEEIKSSEEKVNTFDLFSMESRMGRWAGQENLIYNSLGQLYLNIFNARCIVYPMTQVARGLRKTSQIHLALIEKVYPRLLDIPFEQDEGRLVKLSKANGLFYYLASWLKYYMEKYRFQKRNT